MSARAVARDLRALGAGAPLRAAYEASKRLGGHARVFGGLARRPAVDVPASHPVFPRRPVPDAAVGRARAAADATARGEVRLFGRTIDIGADPDWHAVIDGPGRWPETDWWRIDLRSARRDGDVKWAWELGRHRHLVVLARAAASPDPDPRWAKTLQAHLRSWVEQNPPEVGVHWYSNLEIALRSLAWLEILARVGDDLEPSLRRALDRHLHHGGRHLVADLPYTLSTMRNNHLLGDALGLLALSRAFPGDPTAQRWGKLGTHLFDRATLRLVEADGSMLEDSLGYHRFVTEMLAVRVLLGGAPPRVRDRLRAAARFLVRLGAVDGPVPQYGDWDEGRAVTATGDPTDLAGSVRLGLAAAGAGAPPAWREAHDEVAWYAGDGEPSPGGRAEAAGRDVGGGLARAAAGPFTVWLKVGGGPSHGHADRASSPVLREGRWLVGDPGTGAYNGDERVRNELRSSASHSVLVLDGHDQLVPHRVFRWRHRACGRIGPPVRVGDAVVMWGAHDAYRRLDPPRRIARTVVIAPEGASVTDWVEPPAGASYRLTLPIAPGADPYDVQVGDAVEAVEAVEGLWSRTYGDVDRQTYLVATGRSAGPVEWRVGDPPRVELSVRWLDGAVELTAGGVTVTVVV